MSNRNHNGLKNKLDEKNKHQKTPSSSIAQAISSSSLVNPASVYSIASVFYNFINRFRRQKRPAHQIPQSPRPTNWVRQPNRPLNHMCIQTFFTSLAQRLQTCSVKLPNKFDQFPAPPSVLIEEIHPIDRNQCKTCHYFNQRNNNYLLHCAVHPCGPDEAKCSDYQEQSIASTYHPLPITYYQICE